MKQNLKLIALCSILALSVSGLAQRRGGHQESRRPAIRQEQNRRPEHSRIRRFEHYRFTPTRVWRIGERPRCHWVTTYVIGDVTMFWYEGGGVAYYENGPIVGYYDPEPVIIVDPSVSFRIRL